MKFTSCREDSCGILIFALPHAGREWPSVEGMVVSRADACAGRRGIDRHRRRLGGVQGSCPWRGILSPGCLCGGRAGGGAVSWVCAVILCATCRLDARDTRARTCALPLVLSLRGGYGACEPGGGRSSVASWTRDGILRGIRLRGGFDAAAPPAHIVGDSGAGTYAACMPVPTYMHTYIHAYTNVSMIYACIHVSRSFKPRAGSSDADRPGDSVHKPA